MILATSPPSWSLPATGTALSADLWRPYRYLGVGRARPLHSAGIGGIVTATPPSSGGAPLWHGYATPKSALHDPAFADWSALAGDAAALDAIELDEEDVDHFFRRAHALNRWDLLEGAYPLVWNKWARPIVGSGDEWAPAEYVAGKWHVPDGIPATLAQKARLGIVKSALFPQTVFGVPAWPGFGPKTLAAIAEIRASGLDDAKLAKYAEYVHAAAKCGKHPGPWLWWYLGYLSSWWLYDPATVDPTKPVELFGKVALGVKGSGVVDPFSSETGGCEEDPWLDSLLKIVVGVGAAFVIGSGLAAYAAEAAAATGASEQVQSAATFAAKKIGGAMASAGVTGAPIPQAALHALLSLPPSEIAALVPAALEASPVSFFDGLANDLNKLLPVVDAASDLAAGYADIVSTLKPPAAALPIPGGTTAVLPPGGGAATLASTAAQPPLGTGAAVAVGGGGMSSGEWWTLVGIAATVVGLIFFAPNK